MSKSSKFPAPGFSRQVLVVVGGFGSGKSEVSVNLARFLSRSTEAPVTIADLDVINPYFRSREAARALAELGIRSIIPPGDQAQADLPIIIPEIKGAIQSIKGTLILDVGGDDAGAKVLSSLSDAFTPGRYELLLTVNAYRPFTATVGGTLKIMNEIETASKLKFTGLISNSHMVEHTTPTEILHGIELSRQVAGKTGLPICFVSGLRAVLDRMTVEEIPYPVLPIDRSLLKPWERSVPAEES
jgi:hypothetical protein